MLKEPVWSFKEILGNYETYQEVAISKGFIVNGDEVKLIFDEAKDYNSPGQQRSLFVMLTLEGYPTLQLLNNRVYYGLMTSDFNDGTRDDTEVRQMLLSYFWRYFRSLGNAKFSILFFTYLFIPIFAGDNIFFFFNVTL